jgi:3-hydroxy-3-methylglutaryl CoA synthase
MFEQKFQEIHYASSGLSVGQTTYVPRLYLLDWEFAASRDIDPAKLIRGIGIERMAVPDAHEDAATMAAMSLLDLMQRNDLSPEEIGKIYVGTESGVDEAKAIGTYIIGMLEKVYGKGSFQDCSTVEFKSACIGATHALENICYWAAVDDEGRSGIVIATDAYPLRPSRRPTGSGIGFCACEEESALNRPGEEHRRLHKRRERFLPPIWLQHRCSQRKAQQSMLS